MSSDVKCPFMSLFFFLGGGGAGLWAGGRSVLLRQWKDNMTLSTVRVGHSLAPSPSTPLYYEKSCLHLPFFTLSLEFDRSAIGGIVAAAAFPPCLFRGSRWRDTVLMRLGCNWTLRWGDGDGGSIGGQGQGHVWVRSLGGCRLIHSSTRTDAASTVQWLFYMSALTQWALLSLILTSHYSTLGWHTWERTQSRHPFLNSSLSCN